MIKRIFSKLSLADLMLIFGLTLVSLLVAFNGKDVSENRRVRIHKDHKLFGEYSLNEDMQIRIDEHNLVEIKDGKVRMKEADCHDKRCIKQGATSSLPIICLPNRVVVEIVDTQEETPLILQ